MKRTNAANTAATLPDEGFSRLPAVLGIIPVSRSSWLSGVKSGRYPKGVKLSPGITAWRNKDLRELIRSFDGE